MIFRQITDKNAEPKVPKKSIVAGGISHMQVWTKAKDADKFEIIDAQGGKEEWVKGDKRVLLWKLE